jgi:urea transport system permease protein
MFTLQVGFMSPSFVGIVPSIEMVVFAAVGGRMSVVGAVYGTLLVNFGKTFFSEQYPELWQFLVGATFIAVVLLFPNGLAGMYQSRAKDLLELFKRKKALLKAPVPRETPSQVNLTPVEEGKHG